MLNGLISPAIILCVDIYMLVSRRKPNFRSLSLQPVINSLIAYKINSFSVRYQRILHADSIQCSNVSYVDVNMCEMGTFSSKDYKFALCNTIPVGCMTIVSSFRYFFDVKSFGSSIKYKYLSSVIANKKGSIFLKTFCSQTDVYRTIGLVIQNICWTSSPSVILVILYNICQIYFKQVIPKLPDAKLIRKQHYICISYLF